MKKRKYIQPTTIRFVACSSFLMAGSMQTADPNDSDAKAVFGWDDADDASDDSNRWPRFSDLWSDD